MGRKKGRRRSPFKVSLKKETIHSIGAIVLILIGVLIMISFAGEGTLLEHVWNFIETQFGPASLLIPFLFIAAGLMLTSIKSKINQPNVLLGGLLLFISLLGITGGGNIGRQLLQNLSILISTIGAYVVYFGIALVGFMIVFETSLDDLILMTLNIGKRLKKVKSIFKRPPASPNKAYALKGSSGSITIKGGKYSPKSKNEVKPEKPTKKPSKKSEPSEKSDTPQITTTPAGASNQVYQPPSLDLLEDAIGGEADRGDIKKNADIIEKTLDSFGIQARIVEVNLGPAVTQYALEIALGTKLSRITALQNDLALALAAPTGQIRIEAPIPGRSLVGIEIPNRKPEIVTVKSMLLSDGMKKAKNKITVGLGLDVSGEPVITNIAKMPHVLIAGATGSGKSVSVNAIILQILLRASPEEVKFILVDPKRVELTQFNNIPHLLTPVIVDPEKVIASLEWAINEMENRYKTFAEVGVRNIESYNNTSGFQSLPYIIIVIDELADIMLFAPSKVEDAITRLAQMARATGIHLILATQRPSVDVLTGLIKANIPTRIAFNVATAVDSRVIIDSTGAEKLLGSGDMLYIPPDAAKPSRIQGTFVTDKESQRILNHIKNLEVEVEYTEEVVTKFAAKKVVGSDGIIEDVDDMFEDAVKIVVNYDRASASLLQRRLSVGYARAARILDQLQSAGIVSEPDGSKPRDVLIKSAEEYFSK